MSDCNGMVRTVYYSWKDGATCSIRSVLPDDIHIDCEYVQFEALPAISMYSIAGILMVGYLIILVRTYNVRHEVAMEAAEPGLLYVIVLGSVVACTTIFIIPGEPSSTTCIGPLSTGCIGFTLVFGTLLLRTYRTYRQNRADDHQAPQLSDGFLLQLVGVMLAVDAVLLIAYRFVINPGQEVITKIVPDVGPVELLQCTGAGFSSALLSYQIWPILFLAYKGLVAAALYYFAFETRLVANEFNEPAVTFIVAHVLCGLVIIIGVVIWRLDNNALMRYLLASVAIFAVTLSAVGGLVGWKIWKEVFQRKSGTRQHNIQVGAGSLKGQKILVGDDDPDPKFPSTNRLSAAILGRMSKASAGSGASPHPLRASARSASAASLASQSAGSPVRSQLTSAEEKLFLRIATDKDAGISFDDLQQYVDKQFKEREKVAPRARELAHLVRLGSDLSVLVLTGHPRALSRSPRQPQRRGKSPDRRENERFPHWPADAQRGGSEDIQRLEH